MLDNCTKSPSGAHCWHTPKYWYGVGPAPKRCCWCGEPKAREHGPYGPHDGHYAANDFWKCDLDDPRETRQYKIDKRRVVHLDGPDFSRGYKYNQGYLDGVRELSQKIEDQKREESNFLKKFGLDD